MSRKPSKKHDTYKGYKPKPVSDSEWDQLAANPTLLQAFQEFSARIQRANVAAEQRSVRSGLPASELLDYSSAVPILHQHPELIKFVSAAQRQEQRETSLASTMIPDLRRAAPTDSNPQAVGNMGGWVSTKDQPQGIANYRVLRDWADNNEWTRAAINARREQIGRAEIAVVPGDPRRSYNKSITKTLELMLDQPNERRTNWYELISGVLEDMLVLSCGAISKSMTVARKPIALYQEDAATIKIYPAWSGDPNQPRYLFEEPGTSRKVPLRNDEIIMPILNPATYRYGLSPVQVLRDTIKADLEATKQSLLMMQQKPPPHAFQLPGASRSQLEAVRDSYEREIAGQREVFWFGGPESAIHFPLVFSAKDNQWLEYQDYMMKKICALFQISPQQLGMTLNINLANGQQQQQIFEDTGLIPILLLLEEYLNRELVSDFAPTLPYGRSDLQAVNIRIVFPMVSEAARRMHAQESLEMAATGLQGLPAMTINQVLAARGEEPVPGGDVFWIKTGQGAVPWLGYPGASLGDYAPLATGGALGSQDSSGGPSMDSDDPGPNDGAGKGDENSDGGDKTPSGGGGSAPSSGEQSGEGQGTDSGGGASGGSGDAPAAGGGGAEKSWYDARPFGKQWKPSYMRRSEGRNNARARSYNPDQPRDANGRWGSGDSDDSGDHDPAALSKAMHQKYPHCAFNFDGCDPDVAKKIADQVDTLFQAYPEAGKSVGYIGTGDELEDYSPRMDSSYVMLATDDYPAEDGKSSIFLNSSNLEDPGKMEEMFDAAKAKDWFAGDYTPESMLTHEFGHSIQMDLYNKNNVSPLGFIDEHNDGSATQMMRDFMRLNKDSGDEVSGYSKEAGPVEAWAEAFSSTYHGSPGPYAKKQAEFLDRVYNGKTHQVNSKSDMSVEQSNTLEKFYQSYIYVKPENFPPPSSMRQYIRRYMESKGGPEIPRLHREEPQLPSDVVRKIEAADSNGKSWKPSNTQTLEERNNTRSYNPDQPRDANGRWGSGDGDSGASTELEDLAASMAAKHKNTMFDFTGCDPKVAAKTAEQLDTLMNAYPEVGNMIRYAGTPDMAPPEFQPSFSPGGRNEGAVALCKSQVDEDGDGGYRQTSAILLNPAFYGTEANLQSVFDHASKTNWMVASSAEETATHEFGHAVHYYLEAKGYDRTFGDFEGETGEWNVHGTINEFSDYFHSQAGGVSRYAKTNKYEAFAEAFTMIHHRSGFKQKGYSKGLKKLLDRLLPDGSSKGWKRGSPRALTPSEKKDWNKFQRQYLRPY